MKYLQLAENKFIRLGFNVYLQLGYLQLFDLSFGLKGIACIPGPTTVRQTLAWADDYSRSSQKVSVENIFKKLFLTTRTTETRPRSSSFFFSKNALFAFIFKTRSVQFCLVFFCSVFAKVPRLKRNARNVQLVRLIWYKTVQKSCVRR